MCQSAAAPFCSLGTNAIYIENTFQPSDVVTLIQGKHILHFGGELLDYQANYTPWGNLQSGNFNFTGVYTPAKQHDRNRRIRLCGLPPWRRK